VRALREYDDAVARWLKDEVAPAFVAMKADPARAVAADDAFAAVKAHPAGRV